MDKGELGYPSSVSVSDRLSDLLRGGFKATEKSASELERIRMVNIGLLTILAVGLPFSVPYYLIGVPLVSAAVLLTCLGAVGALIMVRRGISITFCGYLAGSFVYSLLLLSNLNSGGFYDPNFAWFYVVPLVGAVLVDVKAAWIWSAVIVVTTVGFWVADQSGIIVPDNIPTDVHAVQSLFNRLSALGALGILVVLFVRSHQRARREAFRLAHFDDLTELPNRRALMKRLDREIASAQDKHCALLFIDLDRFKTVNDSLGHRAGDQLLREISSVLTQLVDEFEQCPADAKFVARFGGDEFAIVMSRLTDPAVAEELGHAIVGALDQAVRVGDYQIHSGASIGIALSPRDGENADDLLRSGDLAMYRAKEKGGMTLGFCDQELVDASKRWMDVDAGLRAAVDADEFSLAFQPIVDLASRQITAVEALLRWRRADGELVSPAEFIPVAEATGAILSIGEWVLREARLAAERIFALCDAPIRMSVNLSAAQLRSSDLGSLVLEVVGDGDLPCGWLELELTESVLIKDHRRVIALMDALGAEGVDFAIDDFGTGYSSLSYLAELPANRLKVDREFVTTAANSDRQREVTNAIFAMAERLGLPTVAEGIETEEAADLVQRLGCIEGQGNYFSPPVSLERLLDLIKDDAQNPRAGAAGG